MSTAQEHLSNHAEPVEWPGADFTTMSVPLYVAEEALALLREQIARDIEGAREQFMRLTRATEVDVIPRAYADMARIARGEN